MSYSGKIYWHDGLMLLPHHFQTLQKEVLDGFTFQNKISSDYYYGLIDSSLDYALLEDGFIAFKKFKAIMPSGVVLDLTQNTEITPYKINLNSKKDSHVVYIGLPHWSPNSPNTVLNEEKISNTKRMYKVFETKSPNEDTGEDQNELLLRKLNAKLFLDDDDMTNYDVMPIAKIGKTAKKSSNIKVVVDKNYVPPVLNLNASTALKEVVYTTVSKIILNAKESRKELYESSSFTEAPEKHLKSLFRLNRLTESGVELNLQLKRANTSPSDVYTALCRVIVGLGSVIPQIEVFDLPEYNHDELYECFNKLTSTLLDTLQIPIGKPLYKEFNFATVDEGTRSIKLTPSIMNQATNYYLGVGTKMNTKELISIVENGDSLKLLSPSLCTGMAIPGVKLSFQHIPNELLPRKSGLYFFMLGNTSDDPVWKKIIKEQEMVVVGSKEVLGKLDLSLYTLN